MAWRRAERGSSSLEFLTAGVVFLVPLVYFVLALSQIQNAQLATEGAARTAALFYARAGTMGDGIFAKRSAAIVLADHGFLRTPWRVNVGCLPLPDNCAAPKSRVIVDVSLDVSLPGVPSMLSASNIGVVSVAGRAEHPVSRFSPLP